MSARAPARDWAIALPDLSSRLGACAHVALAAPDDALLAAVLAKLFADRQVTVPDTLIPTCCPGWNARWPKRNGWSPGLMPRPSRAAGQSGGPWRQR